jgi:ribosome-associated toxin RatA of RatAB toxin-antitoxin module
MIILNKNNTIEDLTMNDLEIKNTHEEKNMETIENKNTYLLDILGLKHCDFRTLWKEYYKNHRPFYTESHIYKADNSKAMVKDKNYCPSCLDHLFHTLVLDKDPLKMFVSSTIELGVHKNFFSTLASQYRIKDVTERVFNVKLDHSQVNDILNYIQIKIKHL